MPKEGSRHSVWRFRALWGSFSSESSEDSPLPELRKGADARELNKLSFFGGFSKAPLGNVQMVPLGEGCEDLRRLSSFQHRLLSLAKGPPQSAVGRELPFRAGATASWIQWFTAEGRLLLCRASWTQDRCGFVVQFCTVGYGDRRRCCGCSLRTKPLSQASPCGSAPQYDTPLTCTPSWCPCHHAMPRWNADR